MIFSLSVHSEHAIAALEPLRERKHRPDDEHFYSAGPTTSFTDYNEGRFAKLEAAVNAALDALEATGVDPDELREPNAHVRALFTFGLGAYTITPEMVERLAQFHATMWIDTLDYE